MSKLQTHQSAIRLYLPKQQSKLFFHFFVCMLHLRHHSHFDNIRLLLQLCYIRLVQLEVYHLCHHHKLLDTQFHLLHQILCLLCSTHRLLLLNCLLHRQSQVLNLLVSNHIFQTQHLSQVPVHLRWQNRCQVTKLSLPILTLGFVCMCQV